MLCDLPLVIFTGLRSACESAAKNNMRMGFHSGNSVDHGCVRITTDTLIRLSVCCPESQLSVYMTNVLVKELSLYCKIIYFMIYNFF